MKKDVNIIVGIVALVIVAFIVAYRFFPQAASPAAPVTQSSPESATNESKDAAPVADLKVLMSEDAPSKGPIMAKVVVLEYLDPECGACKAFHPHVKKVLSEFEGKIRYVVRHMPYHFNSESAIKALKAAQAQGKYWELLDILFEKQQEWGEKRVDESKLIFGYVGKLGLDMAKFKKDYDNPVFAAKVTKDKKDGEASGVNGTPSFFINGALLTELGEDQLRNTIVQALNK
jgi:protein-disulfide isomerase